MDMMLDYPLPRNWQDLEQICYCLWKERLPLSASIQKHGRSGQRQSGVDLLIQHEGQNTGIQCKLTKRKASREDVKAAVLRSIIEAERFAQKLLKLIVVMTIDRDASLQIWVNTISSERQERGEFMVELQSWDDLLDEINRFPRLAEQLFEGGGRKISPKLSCAFETQKLSQVGSHIEWAFSLKNCHRKTQINVSDLTVTLLHFQKKVRYMIRSPHAFGEIRLTQLQTGGKSLLNKRGEHWRYLVLEPDAVESFSVKIMMDAPESWTALVGIWHRVSFDGNPGRPSDVVIVIDKNGPNVGVSWFNEEEVINKISTKEWAVQPRFSMFVPGVYELCHRTDCDWERVFAKAADFFEMRDFGKWGH